MFTLNFQGFIPLSAPLGNLPFVFPPTLIYLDFIFLGTYSCCHCVWLYQIPLNGKGEQKDPNWEIFQEQISFYSAVLEKNGGKMCLRGESGRQGKNSGRDEPETHLEVATTL